MPYRDHVHRPVRLSRPRTRRRSQPHPRLPCYSEGARRLTGLFTLTGTLSLVVLTVMIYSDLS